MTREHQERFNRGCTCFINPPCDFCTSLNLTEADIYANNGMDALGQYWEEIDKRLHHPSGAFIKNILIMDSDRVPNTLAISSLIYYLDIFLIKQPNGEYLIQKNRYGSCGFCLPENKLPLFLMDPTRDY